MSLMNYLVVSFILREASLVYQGWYLLWFSGHVVMVGGLVVLKATAGFWKRFHPQELNVVGVVQGVDGVESYGVKTGRFKKE
jgi:hypothetical protein